MAVTWFLLAGLIAVAVIGSAVVLVLRHQTASEAIAQAKALTQVEARDVVAPYLVDAALRRGPGRAALDREVRAHVLNADVVRVKVWASDGTVLYSDDLSLIGQRYPLGRPERRALSGPPAAEISDLRAPENVAERHFGKLLEVYLGVQTPTGRRLLFETYQRYRSIAESSNRLLVRSLPALLGGLLLLYLIQAPLAYLLAQRLRQAQNEREQALVEALATADRERRRVAADLHDGVVQGITAMSYRLVAIAHDAERDGLTALAGTAREMGVQLRHWVRELRTYVLVIAPPRLHERGLPAALDDLAQTLRARGITARVDVQSDFTTDTETEQLMYRVAQEASRNIVKHANATTVTFTVNADPDWLSLMVADDGRGLPEQRGKPSDVGAGGAGLRLLSDLAEQSGARLRVVDGEAGGVLVELLVPAGATVSP
jgi:signal transduction histidine kinase